MRISDKLKPLPTAAAYLALGRQGVKKKKKTKQKTCHSNFWTECRDHINMVLLYCMCPLWTK